MAHVVTSTPISGVHVSAVVKALGITITIIPGETLEVEQLTTTT